MLQNGWKLTLPLQERCMPKADLHRVASEISDTSPHFPGKRRVKLNVRIRLRYLVMMDEQMQGQPCALSY